MLEIKKDSRQVPKVKEITANKKYYDILYAWLQCVSIYDERTGERTVGKKEINFSNLVMLVLGGITFIYLIHFLFKTFR